MYPLSLAQLVFGEPATVAATGSSLGYDGEETGVDTELGMLLGYESGATAVLATAIRTMLPLSAAIGGSEGMIELAEAFWSDTTYTVRRPDGTRETTTLPKEGNGYVPMLRGCTKPSTRASPSSPGAPSTTPSCSCAPPTGYARPWARRAARPSPMHK